MSRYLTPAQVHERLPNIALKTLKNWRSLTHTTGKQVGPPFETFGRRIHYEEHALEQWIKSQSTAQPA